MGQKPRKPRFVVEEHVLDFLDDWSRGCGYMTRAEGNHGLKKHFPQLTGAQREHVLAVWKRELDESAGWTAARSERFTDWTDDNLEIVKEAAR